MYSAYLANQSNPFRVDLNGSFSPVFVTTAINPKGVTQALDAMALIELPD